jgi:hypothetical protein
MNESTKAVSTLVLIVSAPTAAIAWVIDRPDVITWSLRLGCLAAAILSLGVILRPYFRSDLVHDYLRDRARTYFNRDGFGFTVFVTSIDGIARMDLYFLNQYDKPCVGRVALRPARGFFLTRANVETIAYEIDCAPAAFGFARLAIPIPEKLQGKRQAFEVGASVHYPEGKGKRLRFHDGLFLRANTNFGNAFGTALTVAGLFAGKIVISRPATITVDLPTGVAEEIRNRLAPEVRTLWRLGDPQPESVA